MTREELDAAIAERRRKVLDLQAEEARLDGELKPLLEEQHRLMAKERARPPAAAKKLAPEGVESDFETGTT